MRSHPDAAAACPARHPAGGQSAAAAAAVAVVLGCFLQGQAAHHPECLAPHHLHKLLLLLLLLLVELLAALLPLMQGTQTLEIHRHRVTRGSHRPAEAQQAYPAVPAAAAAAPVAAAPAEAAAAAQRWMMQLLVVLWRVPVLALAAP
jgi:hypothetical protein